MTRQWLYCPHCHGKTRVQVGPDTLLKNFPLFCPRCKRESRIDCKNYTISPSPEPDAKTQSR